MNPKLRTILISIGLVTLLFLGIFVIPRGLSLYFQTRGGQQVEYVLRSSEGVEELVCEKLPASDEEGLNEIERAVGDLNRALRLNKNNAQAYYYLGKANCLLGNHSDALKNYYQYTRLRPANPLGYIELGFVNEKLGDLDSAKSAWKSADIYPEVFAKIADEEFRAEQYEDALNWYERAYLMGGKISEYSKYNWSVTAILLGKQFPAQVNPQLIPIYKMNGELKIEGDQLQWFRPEDNYWNIRYGQPLSEHPTGDPGVGGMWWPGAAVAVVHIPCKAHYKMQVRALHSNPSEEVGQMQFENNLSPFGTFILTENWQEYEAETKLNDGYHLIGVRVENIGDVFVDWLRVSQNSDCEINLNKKEKYLETIAHNQR